MNNIKILNTRELRQVGGGDPATMISLGIGGFSLGIYLSHKIKKMLDSAAFKPAN
jgi:hypothetical protein